MSERLTLPQKSVLLRAARQPYVTCGNVHRTIGAWLAFRGYGEFSELSRTFKLNAKGLQYAVTGEIL